MHTFTALFDKRADAEAIQDRLQSLGIVETDHGLHDRASAGLDKEPAARSTDKGLWDKAQSAPPAEDRHLYEEAVRRGGFLLTINVDDVQADAVHQVLEGSNAVDFDERTQELRSSGFIPPVAPLVAKATTPTPAGDTLQLAEERLVVGKRAVERGGVRVRSYVVETAVHEQVQLREEHIEIERHPVNREAVTGEAVFQERSFELTERGEQAVVGKQTVITGEIGLHKDVEQRTETISDTVRRTEVEVEDTRGQVRTGAVSDQVVEHAEVVGSDGEHVGMVDHVEGESRIKLGRHGSPDGQHHYIPMALVQDVVGGKVRLRISAAATRQSWTPAG